MSKKISSSIRTMIANRWNNGMAVSKITSEINKTKSAKRSGKLSVYQVAAVCSHISRK